MLDEAGKWYELTNFSRQSMDRSIVPTISPFFLFLFFFYSSALSDNTNDVNYKIVIFIFSIFRMFRMKLFDTSVTILKPTQVYAILIAAKDPIS